MKKILIAEDERPLSKALQLKFEHEGFEVQTAFNGRDALKLLLTNSFDLALLDMIMPELDGFGVLAELKEKEIKTKVIVTSNLGQEEDKMKAQELGAVDYFVKADISIAKIVEQVKAVLAT